MAERRLRRIALAIGLAALALSGCATAQPQAVGSLDELVTVDVADALKRGATLQARGRLDQAARAYRQALMAEPQNAQARIGLAEVFLAKKKPDAALSALTYRGSDASGPAFDGVAGRALTLAEQYARAEDRLVSATKRGVDDWRVWNALGQVYDRQRRFEAALSAYEGALDRGGRPAIVRNNMGVNHLLRDQYAQAARHFQAALDAEPANTAIERNLRMTRALQGRYEAATAGVSAKEAPTVYNDVGVIAMQRGDRAVAAELFTRAKELSGRYHRQADANLNYLQRLEDSDGPATDTGAGTE